MTKKAPEKKVKTLEEIIEISKLAKEKGKKVVHCHGCFDYLHVGHMRHIEEARQQGDLLIVTLTRDEYIKKGPRGTLYSQEQRAYALASLEHVDYVAFNNSDTAIETIKRIKPDVYVKGKEVLANSKVDESSNGNATKKSNLSLEEDAVKSIGGRLYLTDQENFSSSSIINKIVIPEDTQKYLDTIRRDFTKESILKIIGSLSSIRPLIIGDSILDEYILCKPMEKSGKESLVSHLFSQSDIHVGGVFAVANHVAGFCNETSLITLMGSYEKEKVKSSLKNNINANIFYYDGPTLKKTRFLDDYKKTKLFQIYNTDEVQINETHEKELLDYLKKNKSNYDLLILSDFGHGLISENIIDYLKNINKPIAVNCQINGGNLGFNFITKYHPGDLSFISLNDREIRLPMQEKKGDIKVPISKLSKKLDCDNILVTRGKFGSVYYNNRDYYSAPVFTKEPLDTVGAGDAVFSLTSLLAYNNCDPRLVPFLGNCIGALATRIMGNEKFIDSTDIKRFATYFLK